MKVHILDDWFDTLRGLNSFKKLDQHHVTVWNDHTKDLTVLTDRLKEAEVLVLFRERTPISAKLLERLPKLKLIAQRSVYPHVDVSACTKQKVLLCSNMHSGKASIAASELTFALILASARQIPQQISSLKAGNWQMAPGQTLAGRTLGLYGYGRIAKQVATYAKAFGMEVVWWASESGRKRLVEAGEVLASDRKTFFKNSDFVSIHIRLKPETREIIKSEDLLGMKPSATFVNTSRSGVVEMGALEKSLSTGCPGRIALDVFDKEPITNIDDPLICHPNVISTPHIGYVTEDELDLQFSDIYDLINSYASGAPIHMINPEVLQKMQ